MMPHSLTAFTCTVHTHSLRGRLKEGRKTEALSAGAEAAMGPQDNVTEGEAPSAETRSEKQQQVIQENIQKETQKPEEDTPGKLCQ